MTECLVTIWNKNYNSFSLIFNEELNYETLLIQLNFILNWLSPTRKTRHNFFQKRCKKSVTVPLVLNLFHNLQFNQPPIGRKRHFLQNLKIPELCASKQTNLAELCKSYLHKFLRPLVMVHGSRFPACRDPGKKHSAKGLLRLHGTAPAIPHKG